MNTEPLSDPRADDRRRRAARWLLGMLALSSLTPGAYAVLAPHAFYENILGVDLLGAYNQHLLTDVGGLYLGFGLLFGWASVTLARELGLATSAAWGLVQLLHFIYHAGHLANFTLAQATEQTAGQGFYLLLPLAATLVISAQPRMLRSHEDSPRDGNTSH